MVSGGSVTRLALAEYRAGHWAESLTACEKAMALSKGGTASDWFFMAMALWQKADKDKARMWFDKAVAWTREKDPKNKDLLQFWKEAGDITGPACAPGGRNPPRQASRAEASR